MSGRPVTKTRTLSLDKVQQIKKLSCDNLAGFWRYYLAGSGCSYQQFIAAIRGQPATKKVLDCADLALKRAVAV